MEDVVHVALRIPGDAKARGDDRRPAVADMAEARLVLTDDLIRATLRREKAALKAARKATSRGRPRAGRRGAKPKPRAAKPKEIEIKPLNVLATPGARLAGRGLKKETYHGRQRQQTGTFADRRRGRAREIDRPYDRARLDGGRDAEGCAFALRPGDRSPRGDQSEDGRNPLLAPAAGGRPDRE